MSISTLLIMFLGTLYFLFFAWRRLKEDYPRDTIFTFLFIILLFTFGFYFLTLKLFPTFWFWGAFLGSVVGFALAMFRFKLKFIESLEAVYTGLLALTGFAFLSDTVKNQSYTSLGFLFFGVSLLFLFSFLEGKYKDFIWYKSGKVGFSGLTTLGLFFVIRALVATIYPFVYSFAGRVDGIFSALLAFVFFFLLYNLSQKV